MDPLNRPFMLIVRMPATEGEFGPRVLQKFPSFKEAMAAAWDWIENSKDFDQIIIRDIENDETVFTFPF